MLSGKLPAAAARAAVVLVTVFFAVVRAGTIEVTYIGNAGYMVAAGSQKVVIDAMFDEGWDSYLVPSRSTRGKMKEAKAPFDDLDLILVTHWHEDHFDAGIVTEHLRRNHRCRAVVTVQAADRMKVLPEYAEVSERVIAVAPGWGETVEMRFEDIEVTAVGMKHVPYPESSGEDRHRNVQLAAYVVTVGGATVCHIGDAFLDVDERFIETSRIGERGIDAVFIEYFDRSPGSVRVIQEVIRPRAVVATHIPPGEWEHQAAAFREAFAQAVVFEEHMETRTLELPD
jgi:L-ascorbate metabolism protein UlaG (beta-lactamase superfamily)